MVNKVKLNLLTYDDIIYKTNLSNHMLYSCLDKILNLYDLKLFEYRTLVINVASNDTLEVYMLEYDCLIDNFYYFLLDMFIYDNETNTVKIKYIEKKF